ncbi:BON domain-containing protein [Candidatus Nitrospira bockiana]
MVDRGGIIKAVRAAFEHEPRINVHRYPIEMDFGDGVLTLEGEVEHIAAKKLAMELAIAVPGVTGIVDRLHVAPATHMGDGAILDAVRDALLQDVAFQNCTLKVKDKGTVEVIREATADPHGVIEVSVNDGVVLLDDHVLTFTQKCLAGVLAWWVPGSRDVINGLDIVAGQEAGDAEITKVVKLVLEKDRLVKSDGILVGTNKGTVTLEGSVPTEAQKHMAEFDAWYVFAVDNVVNRLGVR